MFLRASTFLVAISLFSSQWSCKEKIKAIEKTPLSDVVHHKILDTVGIKDSKMPERFYDEKLKGYISSFIADAARYGIIISDNSKQMLRRVTYVKQLSGGTEPGVLASCNHYVVRKQAVGGTLEERFNTIEVLEDAAARYAGDSPVLEQELVYHEAGHCLLNKKHLPDNVKGIMNPYFKKGDQRAFKSFDGLVSDMFSPEYMAMMPDAE